jgi:protein-S-isoprenylcysteine O-methyltransferase Ste14
VTTAPRIVPPLYLLASIVAMAALDRYAPMRDVFPEAHNYIGALFLALGARFIIPSALAFRRAGTALRPAPGSSALVTEGAYRFTRNPMYLGFVLITIGIAFLFGALSAFLVPPVFAFILQTQFIVHEERWMEEKFAGEYVQYKNRVRRWL